MTGSDARPQIDIDLGRQRLTLETAHGESLQYPVSTSDRGPGERFDSGCTPRGRHIIRAKIGSGAERGAVFVGRRATGEIYSDELAAAHPDRDWILTRILWLSGCEKGVNRLGNVDTMRRFIYIHGTPDSVTLGEPGSHGCVRMNNDDIIDLFNRVAAGTSVWIHE